MNKFELDLHFTEETHLKTPSELVKEAINGHDADEGESQTHIVEVDEKAQSAISWRPNSCSLLQEGKNDANECIELFLASLERINNVVPIGKIDSIQLKVNWIFPPNPDNNFKNLEYGYKKTFIKTADLFKTSYDCSVVVEMNLGKWKLHSESGPMKLAQLQREYKVFKIKEGFPAIFLFLGNEITNNETFQYSKGNLNEVINYGFQNCETHAKNFGKIVEVIL
jgi:hypothetical protein